MCHMQGTGGTDNKCVTRKVQGALTVCHMQGTVNNIFIEFATYMLKIHTYTYMLKINLLVINHIA